MSLSLGLLVAGMWAMLIAVSAFLVLVVALLDMVAGETPRMFVSGAQAAIAITAVVLFVVALGRLKRAYVNRKLRPA